ncbi:MAG: hypothetical protein FD165_1295 [Gammaproteobacteria bacterium]|nr:MAG: hypothetical protein FD165_1295 [Gammaproteobacteria bacterium]TND05794.1 MAG: hypothetical protein FD120_1007 [Gammaproteobacteria bacterium]
MALHFLAYSLRGLGMLGALAGGSAAAAKNYRAYKHGSVTVNEAVFDVGKEAIGTGAATAIGVMTAGMLGGALLTTALVATGFKYLYDQVLE